MRITISTGPIFPVPAVRGGAVQRLWEGLAAEFTARGHAVTVFAKAYPGQAREEIVSGVRFIRWGGYDQSTSIRRDLLRCLAYAIRAAPRVPPGDIVVTNDFWMPAILPHLRPSAGRVVASIARFPKGQFRIYRACAAIVPVSESVARGIREQTPTIASKVTVVPNSVDAAFLQTPDTRRRGAAGGGVKILFAGRLHPEKGLNLLVEALKRLPSTGVAAWSCTLIGPVREADGGGGEAYVRQIRESTKGLPVEFAAPVYDPADLARIYDAADVLVYPSVAETGEAMPLAPLEAMARGAVPLVSDLQAFREYLQPGINGQTFNHRASDPPGALALALASLVANAEGRTAMSAAAKETAVRFSPAAIAERYLSLFGRLTVA